ncbi:MAG: DsrE family protein [Nitrospinota bacterium]|jgi:sulfur relay (sulfurtransferase) DsrF/TusC family protein
MKKVTVVLQKSPFNTLRNSEALRMSLGLTLANNAVRVVFVHDAVYSLLPAKPDKIESPVFGRHIEMLNTLKCRVVAEKESIEEKGIGEIKYNVEVKDRKRVIELIKDSDSVITY